MLLCKLLIEAPFCSNQSLHTAVGTSVGCGLKPGFVASSDPRGTEVVIFDERAMLPLYVVNMKKAGGRQPHFMGVPMAVMGARVTAEG